MSGRLALWNGLPLERAAEEILPCCGSKAWAQKMVARRPLADQAALLAASNQVWQGLTEAEWLEAFRSHPRIGESAQATAHRQSAAWSAQEQQGVLSAEEKVRIALAEGNQEYERRFGRIFIVCATGKTPAEMLEILQHRLRNDAQTELREAAEQQRQITQIRLKKWLNA